MTVTTMNDHLVGWVRRHPRCVICRVSRAHHLVLLGTLWLAAAAVLAPVVWVLRVF